MLSRAVAVAADIDVAAIQEPVDEGCSHDLVAEDRASLLEAFVRGENG